MQGASCISTTLRASTIGEVTSGNFAPELGHGVALAFLSPDSVEGDELTIDVRGTEIPARVAALPFVKKH